MFKLVYEFWSSNHKDIYSLYIVEEAIKNNLKEYLLSFKKLNYYDS